MEFVQLSALSKSQSAEFQILHACGSSSSVFPAVNAILSGPKRMEGRVGTPDTFEIEGPSDAGHGNWIIENCRDSCTHRFARTDALWKADSKIGLS